MGTTATQKHNQEPRELLTARDLSRLLQISEDSIYRLSRLGKLPKPILIAGSRYRWTRADYEKVIGQRSA